MRGDPKPGTSPPPSGSPSRARDSAGDAAAAEPLPAATHQPSAGRTAGIYVVVAAVYILVSSWVVHTLAGAPGRLGTIETLKGLAFVATTGALLYVLLRAHQRRVELQRAELELRDHKLAEANRRELTVLEAATLAHDLNNALIVLDACIEDLANPSPQTRSAEREARTAIEEVRSLARRLGNALQGREPEAPTAVDFDAVVERATRLARAHADARHCELRVELGDRPEALGTFGEALQLLLNLLLNAAQAAGPRGVVQVSCRRRDDFIEILVDDDGPGVPVEMRQHILEPGVSTKPHGCGLGLVAVRHAVERFGGELSIEDGPLGGARFRVVIPALVEVGV